MKTVNRQRHILFIAMLVLSVALSACSQQPETSAPNAGSAAAGSDNAPAGEGGGSGGTMVIGMTASDVPTLDVVPSQGLEGMRFVGFQLYDGLVRFDPLNVDDIVPGLAESWQVDGKTWTFRLREGVTFHDGTPWNADAAIFNFNRLMKEDFEYYSPEMSALNSRRYRSIETYSKLDDYTLQIVTKEVDGLLLFELPYILFASPEAVKTEGAGYAKKPSGTGPFKFVELTERQHVTFAANTDYWTTPAKLDKLILRPMPDPASRYAALRSGEIDWAEVPPPDAVPEMKASGIQIFTEPYAHVWFYQPNMAIPPFDDVRVREAFVLAIDKEGLCANLLNGACMPANGPVIPQQKWYSTDAKTYEYDPERARQLLAEAGYPDGVKVVIQMPSSGSGNMWPLPMAEYIQMNLAEAGIEVDFQVYDWSTISDTLRGEFPAGVNAIGMSRGIRAPSDMERNFITPPPGGSNNMGYVNDELIALNDRIKATYDMAEQDELMRQASRIVQDDVAYLSIVHDLNMRALSANVRDFRPPSSWFADLRSIWVE